MTNPYNEGLGDQRLSVTSGEENSPSTNSEITNRRPSIASPSLNSEMLIRRSSAARSWYSSSFAAGSFRENQVLITPKDEIRQLTLSLSQKDFGLEDILDDHGPTKSILKKGKSRARNQTKLSFREDPIIETEDDPFQHQFIVDDKSIICPIEDVAYHGGTNDNDENDFWFAEEEYPLLGTENGIHPNKKTDLISAIFLQCRLAITSLPAVALALLLTMLDALSYGIIIFPSNDVHIPKTAPNAGISMFLVRYRKLKSTAISQIVYSAGGSKFKGAVGSMMIEVMPFLHIMCSTIEERMVGDDDHSILATIMVSYACSTIMTGIVFLLIGVFKLGNAIQFFPRHILIGCIGGIGLFLILTGIEVTTGIKPNLFSIEYFTSIFNPAALKLWGSSIILSITLKILQRVIFHPLFVPCFYLAIPFVFHLILLLFRIPMEKMRSDGWMFNFDQTSNVPFYEFWTYFDFNLVNWRAVLDTLPTIFALTFFGILHVPINVPALSVSTNQDIDLSHEIVAHGISNLISGMFGATQNYLTYSNSLLFIRTGGDNTISGISLFLFTVLVWMQGTGILAYIPTIVVGTLIFHLGIDLMKESIFDSWSVGMHPLEYFTIIVIVLVMGMVGFTEVFIYANKSIIYAIYSGNEIRSTVHRQYRQQQFLDKAGLQTRVIKLQGFMFFGTVSQLNWYINEAIKVENNVRFIVLDFSLISGVDYSGLDMFHKIRLDLEERGTHLIFCNLKEVEVRLRQTGIFEKLNDNEEKFIHIFKSLNNALEWCENYLLATLYMKLEKVKPAEIPPRLQKLGMQLQTPRTGQISDAASVVLNGILNSLDFPIVKPKFLNSPFILLSQFLNNGKVIDDVIEAKLTPLFAKVAFQPGEIIYQAGTEPTALYVLESGELCLSIEEKSGKRTVETLLPGTMVGEIEMFSKEPRICTLISNSDSVCWSLSKNSFDEFGRHNPSLALKFITEIAIPFDVVRYYNTVHHWGQLR